jgi:hypothetical protein
MNWPLNSFGYRFEDLKKVCLRLAIAKGMLPNRWCLPVLKGCTVPMKLAMISGAKNCRKYNCNFV